MMSELAQPQPGIRICIAVLGCVQVVALFLAWEKPAAAYVDPGTGYVFLQVAGSTLAGACFYLRHRLKKVFSFHRNQKSFQNNSTEDTQSFSASSAESRGAP
jgi:hypothetical protein